MNYEIQGEKASVRLEGIIDIRNAPELRRMLLEALEEARSLEIDVSTVEEAGLSALQLICACHQSVMRSGRKMNYASAVPEPMREAIKESGFLRHQGCKWDRDGSCFWVI